MKAHHKAAVLIAYVLAVICLFSTSDTFTRIAVVGGAIAVFVVLADLVRHPSRGHDQGAKSLSP